MSIPSSPPPSGPQNTSSKYSFTQSNISSSLPVAFHASISHSVASLLHHHHFTLSRLILVTSRSTRSRCSSICFLRKVSPEKMCIISYQLTESLSVDYRNTSRLLRTYFSSLSSPHAASSINALHEQFVSSSVQQKWLSYRNKKVFMRVGSDFRAVEKELESAIYKAGGVDGYWIQTLET